MTIRQFQGGGAEQKTGLKGFTLAEVLITLGVIGIVAALTLPGIIENHRKKIVEVRLAKFYSTVNQAIIQSELVNGPKEDWDNTTTDYELDADGTRDYSKPTTVAWFDKYFRPYLKALKVETVSGYTNVIVYFPDGSLATFGGASCAFYPEAKNFILNERSAPDRWGTKSLSTEDSGTKYFTFFFSPKSTANWNKHHYKKGLEPYKYDWNGLESSLISNSTYGCKQNNRNERAYCTALIQHNGWKIPKDYPLKF